ncbi:putative transmembrane protein [Toxoplasma gondii p89]|uniref:Putative transmembrane protein n=1 Tax=Toxoplasma gondii p89 TaxID=943119 RepID=A0A086L5A2_TOXGO|nr:putative transmembrane protein [Toxoplasma gondii p89]
MTLSSADSSVNVAGSAIDEGHFSDQTQGPAGEISLVGDAFSESLQIQADEAQASSDDSNGAPLRQEFPVKSSQTLPPGMNVQKPRKLKCSPVQLSFNLWAASSTVDVGDVRMKAVGYRGRDGRNEKPSAIEKGRSEDVETVNGCALPGSWLTRAHFELLPLSPRLNNGYYVRWSSPSVELLDGDKGDRATGANLAGNAGRPRELQQVEGDEHEFPEEGRPSDNLLFTTQVVCTAAKVQSTSGKPTVLLHLSKSLASPGSTLREALPSAIFRNRVRELPTIRRAGFALLDWFVVPPRGISSFSRAAEGYRQRKGGSSTLGIRVLSRQSLPALKNPLGSTEGPPFSSGAQSAEALSAAVSWSEETGQGSTEFDFSAAPARPSVPLSSADGWDRGIVPAIKIYSGAISAYLVPLFIGFVLLIAVPFIVVGAFGICCRPDHCDGSVCCIGCLGKRCFWLWCHRYQPASSGGDGASSHSPLESNTTGCLAPVGSTSVHQSAVRPLQPLLPLSREGTTGLRADSSGDDVVVKQGGLPTFWAPRPAARVTCLILLFLTLLGVVSCLLFVFSFSVQLRQAVDDAGCAATEFFVQLVHGDSAVGPDLPGPPETFPSTSASAAPRSVAEGPSPVKIVPSTYHLTATKALPNRPLTLFPALPASSLYKVRGSPHFRPRDTATPLLDTRSEREEAQWGGLRPPFLSDKLLEDATILLSEHLGEEPGALLLARHGARLFRLSELAARTWERGAIGESLVGLSALETSEVGKEITKEQLGARSHDGGSNAEGMRRRRLSLFSSPYFSPYSSGGSLASLPEVVGREATSRDMQRFPDGSIAGGVNKTGSEEAMIKPLPLLSPISRRLSADSMSPQSRDSEKGKMKKGSSPKQPWYVKAVNTILRWGRFFGFGRKKRGKKGDRKKAGGPRAPRLNSEGTGSEVHTGPRQQVTADPAVQSTSFDNGPKESSGHPEPPGAFLTESPAFLSGDRKQENRDPQSQLKGGQLSVQPRETLSEATRSDLSEGAPAEARASPSTGNLEGVMNPSFFTSALTNAEVRDPEHVFPLEWSEGGMSQLVPEQTSSEHENTDTSEDDQGALSTYDISEESSAVGIAKRESEGNAAPGAHLPSQADQPLRPQLATFPNEVTHASAEFVGARSTETSAGSLLGREGNVEASGIRDPASVLVGVVAAVRELAANLPEESQTRRALETGENGPGVLPPLHDQLEGGAHLRQYAWGTSRSEGGVHQEARGSQKGGDEPRKEGGFAGLKPALKLLKHIRDLSDGESPRGLQKVLMNATATGLDANTDIAILEEHLQNARIMVEDPSNQTPGPAGERFHRSLAFAIASPTFTVILSRIPRFHQHVRELKEQCQEMMVAVKDLSSELHSSLNGDLFHQVDDAVEDSSDRVQRGIRFLDTAKPHATVALYVLTGLIGVLLVLMLVYLGCLCFWWQPGETKCSTVPSLVFWPIALFLAVFSFIIGGALLVVSVAQVDACLFLSREVQHPGVVEALALSWASHPGDIDAQKATEAAKACFATNTDKEPVERNLTKALGLQDFSSSVGEFEQSLRRAFDSVNLHMMDQFLLGVSFAHAILQDTAWVFFLDTYALSSQGASSRTNTYLPVLYSGLQDKARTFSSPFDIPTAKLVGPPGVKREDLLTLPPMSGSSENVLEYLRVELQRIQAKRNRAGETVFTEANGEKDTATEASQTRLPPVPGTFGEDNASGTFLLYGLLDIEEYIEPFYFETLHRDEPDRLARYRIDEFFSVDAPQIQAEIARLKPDPEERIKYENALWLAAVKQRLRTRGNPNGSQPGRDRDAENTEATEDTRATAGSASTAMFTGNPLSTPLHLPFRCSDKIQLSDEELELVRAQERDRTRRLRDSIDGVDKRVWSEESQEAEGDTKILLPYARQWRWCDYDQWMELVESQEAADLLVQTQQIYDRVHSSKKRAEATVLAPAVDTLKRTQSLLSKMDCTPVFQRFQTVQRRMCHDTAESVGLIGIGYQFLGLAALIIFIVLFCAWQTLAANRRLQKRWESRDTNKSLPLCNWTVSPETRADSRDSGNGREAPWRCPTPDSGQSDPDSASRNTAESVDPTVSPLNTNSCWRNVRRTGTRNSRVDEHGIEVETPEPTMQQAKACARRAHRGSTLLPPIPSEQQASVDETMWAHFENEERPEWLVR